MDGELSVCYYFAALPLYYFELYFLAERAYEST